MGYTETQAKEFIKIAAPIIQTEAKKRGYAICSTTIAQAIIEGACGTSGLARPPYNNHFGLKCGSSWKGRSVNMKTKEEYVVGNPVTIKDNFRCYDSLNDCVSGYYDFISTKRYANLKTARNYKQFAEYLKIDGYATSSTYINTLCKTVEKYGLQKYDVDAVPVAEDDKPTLKNGSKGEYVKHVQLYLSLLGYQVGNIDSVYGPQTESCVKSYQKDKKLKVDGIWGAECWKSVGKA